MIPIYILLPLLVSFVHGSLSSTGCSVPDACFGFPSDCHPDRDCHLYFQFDQDDNLDIYVNDVTDEDEYVALAVDVKPELSVEYLICIPHQKRRVRALARQGEAIRIVDEVMAQYVQNLSSRTFVCPFTEPELPENFRLKSLFFVSEGHFSEDMVIPPGRQLSPINADYVYVHKIAASSSDLNDELVLTPDESKKVSDMTKKVQRIANKAEPDFDLEDILADKKLDDEDEDEDSDDDVDSRKKHGTRKANKKKGSSSRRDEDDDEEDEEMRKPRRRNGRPSRYQDDDDDDEDEDDDEGYVPKKKSRRPSPRGYVSEDEDDEEEDNHKGKPRKNKNNNKKKGKKSDQDDYEDEEDIQDDDSCDDESNSENVYPYTVPLIIVTLAYNFFIRN